MQRITVVLPCLNESAILEERLSSLQHLRATGHELILVDGGSSDGSVAIARPLVDLVLAADRGRAVQMNQGAARARGDVLWFLHVDSVLPRGAVQAVLDRALQGPGWGRFDVRLSGDAPMLRVVEGMMNLRSRLTGIATGDQGIFVRRDLFESQGGFADLLLMEDIELSTRLKRIAPPACISSSIVTSSRRWERDGILRTIFTMWILRSAYRLGADPARLARIYYPEQ
jgi:rSAM/selenodomain-associated transferase 2